MDIDQILDKPYWVIDILPQQVPASASGQYFVVEKHFLACRQALAEKYARIVLKANCYHDIEVSLDGECGTETQSRRRWWRP